jgi:signal transduction histidine kinase
MLYLLFVLIKAYRKGRKFSGLTLVGFIIPVSFGINDIFFGLDLIVTGYYSPIGFVIFIVILSFGISSKFAKSYDRVIELSNDLKALNENLEKAVEERTEELKAANSELSILNRQKDRFFSIISHDLKNPFNTLLGITDFLRKANIKDEKELKELYNTLHDSAVKGYDLLEDLLEWSAIQFSSAKPNPVNTCLYDILLEIKEYFEKQLSFKKLELKINTGSSISVLCEKDTLRTIFRNIIGNAIKFSYPESEIIISAAEDEQYVNIKIKDFGIGIPADKHDCIFKIDAKYHREGTSGETGSGMGLVIIKELIERNGGEISFTSQVQKGTEFIISLSKTPLL